MLTVKLPHFSWLPSEVKGSYINVPVFFYPLKTSVVVGTQVNSTDVNLTKSYSPHTNRLSSIFESDQYGQITKINYIIQMYCFSS